MLGLHYYKQTFSSCGEQGLPSSCGVHTVVVSPVVEHRLQTAQTPVIAAHRLQSTGSVAVLHRLSCSVAWGILLGQGLNSWLHPLAGRFFTTEPPGKPRVWILNKSEVFISSTLTHCSLLCISDLCPENERQWAQGQWRILPQEEEVWCQVSRCIWPQSWSVVSTRLWLLSKICGYFFSLFLFLKMCPLCLKK